MPSSAPSFKARAAAELELRRRARLKPFDDWLLETSPTWTWHWPHLVYIRRQLDRLHRRELRFLTISCPPRHGKTEQGTVRWPAWILEQDPTARVITGAYNQKLAEKFSRKTRRIVAGRAALSRDQTAVNDWATTAGGGIRAVGVGSGVTGTGANVIIIDDPVKSRKEADSAVYRDTVWDWFIEDIWSRREPGCVVVITMTRWHEDDLVGRIKGSDFAHLFEHINLPALAEDNDPLGRQPGEALCPDRYSRQDLELNQLVMKRNFYALYQGSPRPAEGNKFQRSWFRYWRPVDKHPGVIRLATGDQGATRVVRLSDCRIFMTGDLAVSKKTSADWTVIAAWAVTPDSDLILLDLWRARASEPEVLRMARKILEQHRAGYVAFGANGLGLPILENMRRGWWQDGERLPGLPVRGINEHLDKVANASTALIRTEAGQIYFPATAPWLADFEAELLSFPDGTHDDQVDTFAHAAIDVFYQGAAPEPEKKQRAREIKEQAEQRKQYYDPDAEHWWQ